MPINANKVIKVNGVPFLVKRVVSNIDSYSDEFIKKVLQNTATEYQVRDGNGNAYFCNKIKTYELNGNTWRCSDCDTPEQRNTYTPKKRIQRTRRNKKKCRRL
jgi:hypothetical protein